MIVGTPNLLTSHTAMRPGLVSDLDAVATGPTGGVATFGGLGELSDRRLSCLCTPAEVGYHIVTWSGKLLGVDFILSQPEIATTLDVRTLVSSLLQAEGEVLGDIQFSQGMAAVFTMLLANLSHTGLSYSLLTRSEASYFDQALALLIAGFCTTFVPATTPIGEVSAVTTALDSTEYHRRYAVSDECRETVWADQAWALLSAIPIVSSWEAQQPQPSVFKVVGHRRAVRNTLGISGNPLYKMFSDDVLRYMYDVRGTVQF